MTDRTAFGAETATDDVLNGIDLSGKTVLITGGTSGLGAESARAMASKGAHVIITGRDVVKADAVALSIANETGQPVETEELDRVPRFDPQLRRTCACKASAHRHPGQ